MGNLCGSEITKFEDQDYRKLRKDLVKRKELFEDNKFDESLLPQESREAVWLRPHEICDKLKNEQYRLPEMGPRTRSVDYIRVDYLRTIADRVSTKGN